MDFEISAKRLGILKEALAVIESHFSFGAAPSIASLHDNAGVFDHFRPFRQFRPNERGELFGA